MLSASITVPATAVNLTNGPATGAGLGTPIALTGFDYGKGITAQLPTTAGVGDGVAFFAGDISNATSSAQLIQVSQLGIPAAGNTGQQPTPVATLAASYLYLYAVRTSVGTAGALTATVVGQETAGTATGPGNPNAILQGGNAFGAQINIGPTDGQAMVIGGTFTGSNSTSLTLDTTTTGPVNLGTNANAKTVTIGNSAVATAVLIKGGATISGFAIATGGQLHIGNMGAAFTNTADSVQVLTGSNGSVTIAAAGAGNATLQAGATGDLNLIGGTTVIMDTGVGGSFEIGQTNATRIDMGTAALELGIGVGGISTTIGIGNNAGTTSLFLNAGTGGFTVLTTGDVSIMTGATGAVTLDSGATGAVNIGTGAFAKTVTLGSTTTTSTTLVQFGSGGLGVGAAAPGSSGVAIDTPAAGTITIGGTHATLIAVGGVASGQTVSVGVLVGATTTINIGNATNEVTTLGLGSGHTTSTTTLLFGSGGLGIGATAPGSSGITMDTPAAGTITIGGTNATSVAVGGGATTTINIGTSGVVTATVVGSGSSTSSTKLQSGSGGIGIGVNAPGTGGIAVDTTGAESVLLGNTNAAVVTIGNATAGFLGTQNGPWAKGIVNISNGTGTFGSAATTVNVADFFTITSTAGAQTFTVPSPTGAAAVAGRRITVQNIGTVNTFTISGVTLPVSASNSQSALDLVWDNTNTRWVLFST